MITLNSNAQQQYNSIPEWDHNAEDLFFEVSEALTIADILEKYTATRPNRYHRVPCPIHRGKHQNFSYNDKFFMCFKCGASGDVIELAKELNSCKNRYAAAKMLDADFGLGLLQNNRKSLQRHLEIEKLRIERERQRWLEQKEKQHFRNLILMRNAADIIIKRSAPTNEDEDFPEIFCKAIDFRTRIVAQIEEIIEGNLSC